MSAAQEFLHKAEETAGLTSTCPLVYGVPTLERPYGVALWPLFRYACQKVFQWDPESFHYEFNSSVPLSSVPSVTLAISSYYLLIFGGSELMKYSPRPFRFHALFVVHNAILTAFSLLLLLLLCEQLTPIVWKHGIFYAICNTAAWTQKIEILYYLNYLTKFYELLDTMFLVVRKKKLTFLHTYHHGATAALCFTQLNGRTSVSWVPITLNLGVHVVMYFYYFLTSLGVRPWWKTWVTRFQIIQFIVDLGFVYFATYTYFTNRFWPWWPNCGNCAGKPSAAINGCLILTSYLFLFISFYIKSYLVPKAKRVISEKQQSTAAKEESDPSTALKSSARPATTKKPRSRRA